MGSVLWTGCPEKGYEALGAWSSLLWEKVKCGEQEDWNGIVIGASSVPDDIYFVMSNPRC